MTVLEAIQRGATFLARKGVDAPRLQVEWLLAHLLRIPRLQLYLEFDRLLTGPEVDALRTLVTRRGQREPLQHILGTAVFHNLELKVNRHVLVPRPETELLVELALEMMRERTADPITILDFGSGSGCVALTLAHHLPQARVHGVDLSPEALIVARENAARHQLENRVWFHCGDGFAVLPPDLRFDLIVANPPYIPSGEIDRLEPEVKDFDPRLALDGGPDGLTFHRRLALEASARLRPASPLLLEFGDGQEETVRSLFADQNWVVERVARDYSGRPRVLVARPRSAG